MSKDLQSLQSLNGVELVDALLEEWPTQERSALEWDDFAEKIMSRLDEPFDPLAALSPEEVTFPEKILLAPVAKGANTSGAEAPMSHPLSLSSASSTGEGGARKPHLEETMGAVSQRGDRRSSLQDLAKLANEGPRSQRGGNGPDSFAAAPMSQRSTGRLSEGSGVVDLQSLTSLPEAPSSEFAVPSSAAIPPKSDTFAVSAPVASAPHVVAAVPSEAPASLQESIPPMPVSIAPAYLSDSGISQPRRMSGPGVGVIAGGLVGVLAVAAGALFFVTTSNHKGASVADTAAASVAVTTPAETKGETAAVAPVAQVEEVAKPSANPSDGALDPSALPVSGAKDNTKEAAAGSHHSHASKDAPVAAVAAPSSKSDKASAKETKDSKGKVAAAEPTPPPPSGIPEGALGDAMKKASSGGVVGAGVEKDSAPTFAAGTVPQRPSQGTLTSALGRVLSKAKSCIGPDDPISRASVVFGSAGTVQSVAVSGNAAGKPAEACIKTALSGAKLNTPFAEPTYTTTVTIRP